MGDMSTVIPIGTEAVGEEGLRGTLIPGFPFFFNPSHQFSIRDMASRTFPPRRAPHEKAG